MPTFQIVEDECQTRDLLFDLLSEEFPEARIDVTDNLAEAIRLARETRGSGEHYDVALLDVNLPLDDSGTGDDDVHPEVRRELLRALTYATFVVNYSTEASQARLREEVDRLREPNAPAPILIHASPGQPHWPEDILRLCRRVVHGRRIAEQLDRILQSDRAEPPGVAARSPRFAAWSNGTQALGDLMRDIKLYWNDLDEELRRRVRLAFDVTVVDGEVLVDF